MFEEECKILELLSSSECVLESETGVPAIAASRSLIEESADELLNSVSSEESLTSVLLGCEDVANQFSIVYFVLGKHVLM